MSEQATASQGADETMMTVQGEGAQQCHGCRSISTRVVHDPCSSVVKWSQQRTRRMICLKPGQRAVRGEQRRSRAAKGEEGNESSPTSRDPPGEGLLGEAAKLRLVDVINKKNPGDRGEGREGRRTGAMCRDNGSIGPDMISHCFH